MVPTPNLVFVSNVVLLLSVSPIPMFPHEPAIPGAVAPVDTPDLPAIENAWRLVVDGGRHVVRQLVVERHVHAKRVLSVGGLARISRRRVEQGVGHNLELAKAKGCTTSWNGVNACEYVNANVGSG